MGRNQEGTYSWDGSTCESHSCAMGWMHGGGGGISILVYGTAGSIEPHEGTPVTIFGYEGSYLAGIPGESFTTGGRRASCERWMVDIQGTTVTVKFCAKPGVPEAQIREAHRIIRSMRVEPRDSDLGFRLLFTLTTNTWDSG